MLVVKQFGPWLTPVDEREPWEGYDEACCIEELQPRKDMPISEKEMIVVGYEDGSREAGK